MRLVYNETKNGRCYYVIRSVSKNGKNTSETFERLGYPDEICEKYNCDDPLQWMKDHVAELNETEKDRKNMKILVPFDPNARLRMDEPNSFNAGYLFLQQVYYDLRIDLICSHISKRYAFRYDLNSILSRLIYGRILFPGSKLSTYRLSKDLLEPPAFEYHQVGRALSVIAKEFDYIQSELYRYSTKAIPRNTGVLYYDCTNFYFETESEDEISNEEADANDIAARKYSVSKQHQPSPLVQMGLFMDYSGIPLAISINRGNKNEQITLTPLEEKIMQDFDLSRFVVCTDAGLDSDSNRKFNNFGERSFITTVSIKGMKQELQNWCLETTGWRLEGSKRTYDISAIENTDEDREKYYGKTFYKETYIEGYDKQRDIEFNQTLIVTYSLKYRDFLRYKREGQIQRAQRAIDSGASSLEKKNAHDYRRFVRTETHDSKGKSAKITYSIDQEKIDREKKYDGFYAVETNLEDSVHDIIKVNHGRWEIEESFRIMKDEFRSRPAYLSRSDRIKAHFMTCFIALLEYRILERRIGEKYTCDEIVNTLRAMRVTKAGDTGYIPSYTRTALTDALHESAGFRTDYEIIREKSMRGVIRKSKERQH